MQIEAHLPRVKVSMSQRKLKMKRIVRNNKPWAFLTILFSAVLIVTSSGCGSGYGSNNPTPTNNGVTVSPSSATIQVSGT